MKPRSLVLSLFASIFCLLLSQNALSSPLTISIPNGQWWEEVRQGNSNLATKLGLEAPPEALKTLAHVRERMLTPDLAAFTVGLLPSDEVNAFAKKEAGYTLIIFTRGFLLRFGNDADVLATTLGHEMAHHLLGHTNTPSDQGESPLYRLTNHSHINLDSQSKLPNNSKPNSVAKISTNQVLDHERQADLLGMQWAIKAGFSACGSYRLAQGLEELKNGISPTVNLSSHPSNFERMQISQQYGQLDNRSTSCLADSPILNTLTATTETSHSQELEELFF